MIFSQRGHVEAGKMRYWIELEPRATWELDIDVVPSLDREEVQANVAHRRFGEERERVEASLMAWNLRVPKLRSTWDDMDHAYPLRRSPTLRHSGCGAGTASATCRRRGCPGS